MKSPLMLFIKELNSSPKHLFSVFIKYSPKKKPAQMFWIEFLMFY